MDGILPGMLALVGCGAVAGVLFLVMGTLKKCLEDLIQQQNELAKVQKQNNESLALELCKAVDRILVNATTEQRERLDHAKALQEQYTELLKKQHGELLRQQKAISEMQGQIDLESVRYQLEQSVRVQEAQLVSQLLPLAYNQGGGGRGIDIAVQHLGNDELTRNFKKFLEQQGLSPISIAAAPAAPAVVPARLESNEAAKRAAEQDDLVKGREEAEAVRHAAEAEADAKRVEEEAALKAAEAKAEAKRVDEEAAAKAAEAEAEAKRAEEEAAAKAAEAEAEAKRVEEEAAADRKSVV